MTAIPHGKFSGQRLVVFGCGYVGSAVAEAAVARGMKVTALTRNAAKAEILGAGGIGAVVADLASDAWHDQLTDASDYVLDCVSSGGAGTEGYRHSYLGGMQSILRWARRVGGVGTLVYTSSTSVYPQGGGAVVDESAEVGGSERADVLVATERALMGNAGAARRWFVLRLAGIYGPHRHSLLEQVRIGTVAGTGDHHLNLAHRDDIAAAIWAGFGAPPDVVSSVFNIADDGAARKAEITTWLAAQLGLPAPKFTGGPSAGRRTVTPDRVISNARLRAVFGWRPAYPSFREGYMEILNAAR